ncbi:XdhC family protein [Abyssalbus ytuae]|uniref:XdhC family protein n=1 Tax=Abyssalbus ytuae TaxID=2926907 RepID=A0A9E7D397_9FLAO|nr:XdhC/CoxI family protein [Abyssalbus ytuae]UOB17604.1 XdhC family protein [Abyssalbus ytuae]
MVHELKKILNSYEISHKQGLKTVLASVVALNGSSYRRPGVRMLIEETGKMTGAVSGGCVEKEIWRQSQSVFENDIPKMMQYDGRFRLGCEGILHILIEPFHPEKGFIEAFRKVIKERLNFKITSRYSKKTEISSGFGTVFNFTKTLKIPVFNEFDFNTEKADETWKEFSQTIFPCFKLVIIGAEHDAVQLCSFASLTGWEVTVVAAASDMKTADFFPGIHQLINTSAEEIGNIKIDSQTAVILMTHSFVNDLKFLVALKNTKPAYLGLLGPVKRREKLLQAFLEYAPEVDDSFFDVIHGPAGLNIGAETPQEIAISILSEILSVIRQQQPVSLKTITGTIHKQIEC